MKNKKRLLFGVCGFAGGLTGALVSEMVPDFATGASSLVFQLSLWSAAASAMITLGLFAAGEIYNRKPFSVGIYKTGLVSGLISGAIAGFAAQSVFTLATDPGFFDQVVLRSICWAIMGSLLGWRLSSVVPNLGIARGLFAGGLGGFIGGIVFIITSYFISEVPGRMIGMGLLGASLGIAVVAIEELFRYARLDVIWAPGEVTSITLGNKPVHIGGGDDHVYIHGLPQHALAIALEGGKVQCIDSASGKRSDLKEGSTIKIGKVEVVVRTKNEEKS
jgi:hypothetical protein